MGSWERHDPEVLTREQRALYDDIRRVPRASADRPDGPVDALGRLTGPFDAMLHNPSVGGPLQRLGAALRYETALDAAVREMVILLVAGHRRCAFERAAHRPIARRLDVGERILTVLDEGSVPDDLSGAHPTASAALSLAQRLLTGRLPGDAALADLHGALTPQEVFEVSTLVGYYWTLANQLALFGVQPSTDDTES